MIDSPEPSSLRPAQRSQCAVRCCCGGASSHRAAVPGNPRSQTSPRPLRDRLPRRATASICHGDHSAIGLHAAESPQKATRPPPTTRGRVAQKGAQLPHELSQKCHEAVPTLYTNSARHSAAAPSSRYAEATSGGRHLAVRAKATTPQRRGACSFAPACPQRRIAFRTALPSRCCGPADGARLPTHGAMLEGGSAVRRRTYMRLPHARDSPQPPPSVSPAMHTPGAHDNADRPAAVT